MVGDPLKLELNFTFLLKHVTKLIVLEKGLSTIAVDKFDVVGNLSKMDFVSLHK